MKKTLFAALILSAFACNTQAPKTEPAVTTEFATVVDSTKGVIDFAGPDVDLLKKLVSAIEKADYATVRTCYADSAVIWYNMWAPDTTQKGTPIDEALAGEQKLVETTWGDLNFGEPIYEVVTTASGEKYGHLWARIRGKNKKNGKALDVPLFASFLIKDGKLQWEWNMHDSKRFE
jgi:hypothetical protein